MPQRRRAYSASRARRTSRQVRNSTIGTHVHRHATPPRRRSGRNEALVRRARLRRVAVGVLAIIVVVGISVGAGFMALRGVVGGELSLKGSDAEGALVAVRSDEPSYTLLAVELGAVADPLDNEGPDAIFLLRTDRENRSLAVVNVPASLQITLDNQSKSISSLGAASDASMIEALSTLAKVDISHFVKVESEEDLANIVDTLGGVQVDVSERIDDPHAGRICIPEGQQTLDGASALTFLRATNLAYGEEDRLVNQLDFAAQLIAKLFSEQGSLIARIESIDTFFQTDYSLGDIESIGSWLGGVKAGDISTAFLPGYFTAVTNVTGSDEGRYISTPSEVGELMTKLENNEHLSADMAAADLASPASFTVSIQNGTNIEGAAASVASLLKADGFKVGDVGNAENPIYDETIVVYKDGDGRGLSRAKAVIDALGVGRPVDGDAYYRFDSDVLLIIGADNKPVA